MKVIKEILIIELNEKNKINQNYQFNVKQKGK